MMSDALLVAAGAFVISAGMTGLVRKIALSRGVMDVPNQRSSHSVPTPRGGGVAIVVSAAVALIALFIWDVIDARLLIALLGGGGAVAAIGLLDDRRPVRPAVRLAVHFSAALWALVWLDGLPPVQIGERVFDLGWGGYVLGAVGIVWTLNLFNFMDGIDGIAASEASFIGIAGGLLGTLAGGWGAPESVALVLFAASCGFLLWNVPPARIFMGDVGSGYLGYFVGVTAIAAAREEPVALFVWVILGGTFFVDATITFVRRLFRGERVFEAHRSHAYQWLARRWGGHGRVTLLVCGVNCLWLAPIAWLAATRRSWAPVLVLVALVPLAMAAIAAGSGRHETCGRVSY